MNATTAPSAPLAHPDLLREPVAWLGTSSPDGEAALVPTWFTWDGRAFLVASKPGARKVRNVRANPHVMLGIARVGVEMEAQLIEGCAEVLPTPSADAFRGLDLAKYDTLLAADGLTWEAFFARYPAVIRIEPARFLPWQGPALARVMPASTPVTASARAGGLRGRVRRALGALARRPAGAAFRPAVGAAGA